MEPSSAQGLRHGKQLCLTSCGIVFVSVKCGFRLGLRPFAEVRMQKDSHSAPHCGLHDHGRKAQLTCMERHPQQCWPRGPQSERTAWKQRTKSRVLDNGVIQLRRVNARPRLVPRGHQKRQQASSPDRKCSRRRCICGIMQSILEYPSGMARHASCNVCVYAAFQLYVHKSGKTSA